MSSLSLESLCNQKIAAMGSTYDAVAALSGMPTTRVRFLLQGTRSDPASLRRIYETVLQMERFYNACSILPLNMKNVTMLKPLLAKFADGELSIQISAAPAQVVHGEQAGK